MASATELLGEFLEDGVRLKRTARKSTYVPKTAISPIKNTSATSVRTPTNGSCLKSKNGLRSAVLPPKVCSTIEEVQTTERILKLQKAKKGFIRNSNKNNILPNSLNGGPITRSSPSLAPQSLLINKSPLTTSHSPGTGNSSLGQKMQLRVRETKNDTRDVVSNIVNKKTAVLGRPFTTPKVNLTANNYKILAAAVRNEKESNNSRNSLLNVVRIPPTNQVSLINNNLKKLVKSVTNEKESNNSSNSPFNFWPSTIPQISLISNNYKNLTKTTVAKAKDSSVFSNSLLKIRKSTTPQVSLIRKARRKLAKTITSEKESNISSNSSSNVLPSTISQVSPVSSNLKKSPKAVASNNEINFSGDSTCKEFLSTTNEISTARNLEKPVKTVACEKDASNYSDKNALDVETHLQRKRKSTELENTSEKVRVIDTSSENQNSKLECNESEEDKNSTGKLLNDDACDKSDETKSVENGICADELNKSCESNQESKTEELPLSTVTDDQSKDDNEAVVEAKAPDCTPFILKDEKCEFNPVIPDLLDVLTRNEVCSIFTSESSEKSESEVKSLLLSTEEQFLDNVVKCLPAPQLLKPSTSSKSSLLQHLPNIDVIDDVEFLSFETEDDLHRFVKRHPTCTLDLTRRNGVLRTRGDPIKLTKTTDVTKIKGWRNKIFESDDHFLIKSKNRLGYPSFKSFSHRSLLAEKCTLENENFEDEIENDCMLEPLDLDIDVYEDRSLDDSNCIHQDDEDKVSQSDDPSQIEGINTYLEFETPSTENNSKSAFISDYLDDFLRNKSELRTSLDEKIKTEDSPSKRIHTKVVWPTQAGSPSRELTKIKPPPFQISLPVKKPVETNLSKGRVGLLFSQSVNMGLKESNKIPSLVNSKFNKNGEKVTSAKMLKGFAWIPAVVSLQEAINAVRALVYPVKSPVRLEKKRKIHSTKPISEERVYTAPTSNEEKQETPKVNNLTVTISKQTAEFALSALKLLKAEKALGKIRNLEKLSHKMSVTLKPKENDVPSKLTLEKSVRVSESLPKLTVAQLDDLNMEAGDARPPSPYSADLIANINDGATVSECLKPYCQMGCVCDSLKVPKRKRGHCGKSLCMFTCTCKTVKKVEEDPLARHKRQIRLPARLKDSFLWNNGRDLPLNFDWDTSSVHRKGEVRDEQTKVLWKDSAKWNATAVRSKEAKKKVVHRVKNQTIKNLGDLAEKLKIPKRPMADMGIKYPSRPALPSYKETSHSFSGNNNNVEASRANLQKALSKQLLGYKPCVVNVKKVFNDKGGGKWKIVNKFEDRNTAYMRKLDEKRNAEPNQMLPHDWRFVSKPPEQDPSCSDERRAPWKKMQFNNVLCASTSPSSAKRLDMRSQLKRLNYLIKPMMRELKNGNPGIKNTKTLLVDLAVQSIKRLKQKEKDLLIAKGNLMFKRGSLFQRFKLQIAGMSVEEQKAKAKELAKLLHSCCKGVVRNRMGRENFTSRTSITRSYQNADKDVDIQEIVSEAEFEDYLSVNTSGEDSSEDSDEPRVVIENDLEDECEANNTLIDISSNNMAALSSAAYLPRSFVKPSNKTVIQPEAHTVTNLSNLFTPVGQWTKVTPICAKNSFNMTNIKLSKETIGNGSKEISNANVGKVTVDGAKDPQQFVSIKINSSALQKDGEKTLPGMANSSLGVNKEQYATILIPVSMLSNNNLNSKISLENSDGSKKGGILLRPIATTAPNNSPSNMLGSLTSDKNYSVDLSDTFKRPTHPAVRLKFTNTKIVKKMLQFTPTSNQVTDQPTLSANNFNRAITNLESFSESKVNSSYCSPKSKATHEVSPSGSSTVVMEGYSEQTDNVLENQCTIEDDSEVATEGMFKIVGLSSISEDEFRLKED